MIEELGEEGRNSNNLTKSYVEPSMITSMPIVGVDELIDEHAGKGKEEDGDEEEGIDGL
jgi:hypothetical protein